MIICIWYTDIFFFFFFVVVTTVTGDDALAADAQPLATPLLYFETKFIYIVGYEM